MTIEQFDNHGFKANDIVAFKGKYYEIVGVDFEQKLIAIDEFRDGGESWKRCENVEIFKHS